MAEEPFKPFTPAPLSLDLALTQWMRRHLLRYAGPFYRVQFVARGATPRSGATPATPPTEYQVRLFTDDRKGAQNGVSFTAGSLSALAHAVDVEAPRFTNRRTRR